MDFKEVIKEQRAKQASRRTEGIIQNSTMTVRLDDPTISLMDSICRKYGVSRSELFRCLLYSLEENKEEKTQLSTAQMMLSVEKGTTEYLSEAIYISTLKDIIYDAVHNAITEDGNIKEALFSGAYHGVKDK